MNTQNSDLFAFRLSKIKDISSLPKMQGHYDPEKQVWLAQSAAPVAGTDIYVGTDMNYTTVEHYETPTGGYNTGGNPYTTSYDDGSPDSVDYGDPDYTNDSVTDINTTSDWDTDWERLC